jgi:hypothetical protein
MFIYKNSSSMSTNELITYIRRIDYNQATLPQIIRDSYEEKNNRFDKIMEDFSELRVN